MKRIKFIKALQFFLFSYLCFIAVSAVFDMHETVRGEHIYGLKQQASEYYHYCDGNLQKLTASPEHKLVEDANGNIIFNENEFRKYDDGRIVAYSAVDAEQKIMWLALFASLAIVAACTKAFGFVEVQWSSFHKKDYIILGVLLVFAFVKRGVIDVPVWGSMMGGLEFGVQYYAHGILTSSIGALATFPYSPLCLFVMECLSNINGHLRSLGIYRFDYSFVTVFLVIVYFVFSAQMSLILHKIKNTFSRRFYFYFVLFNPFGFYYIFMLGQVDVLALLFFVQALVLLFVKEKTNVFWVAFCCVLSVSVCKPQHILCLLAFAFSLLGVSCKGDVVRYVKLFLLVIVGLALVHGAFARYPLYLQSLAVNPQAYRIEAIWYSFFNGAVGINRPMAFLGISLIFSLFIAPSRLTSIQRLSACLLVLGVLAAFFQVSYAHTFGLSIFILPAVLVVSVLSDHSLKMLFFWAFSICALAAWGTGPVGDFTNFFGGNFFSGNKVLGMDIHGRQYVGLISTIEYTFLYAYGFIFLFVLKNMDQYSEPTISKA